MEAKTDSSYGIIPLYKRDGEWQVLLIHQISYRGANDTFWTLPKGHAELSETPLEAARRELMEETGIVDIKVEDEPLIDIGYSFMHEGVRINKTVSFYLGFCEKTDTYISQPHEIKELRWCSLDEAQVLVTHDTTRTVLANAHAALQ